MKHQAPDWDPNRQRLLDAYLDNELDPAQRVQVEGLLRDDPRFTREVRLYRALFAGLAAMPHHDPPAGFDLPILAAVLPARVPQQAVLVRAATRMYLALSLILTAAALSLLAFLFRGQTVESTTANGLGGLVNGTIDAMALGGRELLDGVLAVHWVMTPLLTAFRPLANGLSAAAGAAAPSVVPILSIVVLLAALVLSWALHSNRRKGFPHVSLSL